MPSIIPLLSDLPILLLLWPQNFGDMIQMEEMMLANNHLRELPLSIGR